MKKLFALFAAALFIYSISFANIRRLGYSGIPRAGVDYADFAAAQTASAAGDTIQIYLGFTSSGSVSKQLVIMGFGYNFDVNPNLQVIGGNSPSSMTQLTFVNGSQGSIAEGLDATFYIQTPNITIRRCYGTILLYNNSALATATANNLRVESCVVTNIYNQSTAFPTLNTQVYNSIMHTATFYVTGSSGSIINCATPGPLYAPGTFNLYTANFLVKNCIVANYTPASVNTVWENNFFGDPHPGTFVAGSNNRWSQVWKDLFERLGNTSTGAPADYPAYYGQISFDEDYYILRLAGSAATNGGFDAGGTIPTDCGIYGGELLYRYKLSGVPAVPAIYKLTAPTSAATTNPYNVTISVRSNN